MFAFNFIYELKLLLRSRWLQLLSLVLLLLFSFSTYNGKEKVAKRTVDIVAAKDEMKKNDEAMLSLLDSIEKGLPVSVSRWRNPSSPMVVGNYHPRVAAMEPAPMAFVSTGQADLFTHYVMPKATGDDFALNFTEMASPVQLLFGSFDLAFVIVYLLPLIIIAFSYNVLSSEKESGSIKLLAAQPINIQTWVLQKLMLRFFWLAVLVTVSLLLVCLLVGIEWQQIGSSILPLLGLVLAYMLFWFALAFLVNLWVGSSAKNAISLLGLWVLFVLLAPSTLNQLSSTLYPIPSRTLMINEMRELKADVTKRQDKILDNFLRDHPEYAINDTTQRRGFYHRYMASQELVREELAPLVNSYEEQLQKQQHWLNRFKWLSPAITVQESLNRMAGTSTQDYEHYRAQVVGFSQKWRSHFMPYLYNNKTFKKEDHALLPSFGYTTKQGQGVLGIVGVLLLLSILLCTVGWYVSLIKKKNQILIN